MELRLGLVVPSTGARVDVVVRARDGAGLGEVRAQLLDRVLPQGSSAPLSVGGVVVDDAVLLGAAPLVKGALLHVGSPPAGAVPAALQVRVVGGADAGRIHPLPSSGAVVGRTGGLRLAGDAVSRRHCRLDPVGGPGVRVVDLGSANGTAVEGEPVPAAGADLGPGMLLAVGTARLAVAPVEPSPVPLRPTGDGHLTVDLPPRLDPPVPLVQVVVPTPPPERERGPLPLLAVLAPLVLGVGLWRLTGSTTFLLFTLLSPVLVVGAYVTERRAGRRRSRRERAVWAAQREVAEQVLREAVRADELARRARWLDLAAVVLTATGPGPRLWERGRGGLDLRLGLADQPARVEATGDLDGLVTTARDVPVVVPLGQRLGVLGVAGDGAAGLARSLLVQAAVLHGPRDLQVVVLAAAHTAGAWGWARWLPHLLPDAGQDCQALLGLGRDQAAARVAELTALLDARRAEPPGPARSDHRPVLVVVDGTSALREVPGLVRLLADGPAQGVLAVCVEVDPALLPAECRATAVVTAGELLLSVDGAATLQGRADLLAADLAEQAARALAPLRVARRDRSGAEGLPPHVRWTSEVDLPLSGDGSDAGRVLARWQACGRTTSAVLGRSADGVLAVDLVRDGPHALVAGTTGSGKSELLQTLIASLALGNRPDELALVLVDYKGGAAFGPCARLPHVVGTVTDLDGALVERALASLSAELARRETVLRDAGCSDLEEHRRTGTGTVLPRLVLVVDEFAALAEELPDFVTGLVGVAQRGRSLGVHLVLATQRPEGVVSADIRANTNLRLCLAVTRDTESRDVIDSPVAAAISRTTPGRAWLRTGHTDLVAFQAARVGGRRPATGAATGPVVEVSPVDELGDPLPRTPAGGDGAGGTDLALLTAACADAAERLGLPAGSSPWLPPLPTVVVASALVTGPDPAAGVPGRVAPLAYGLLDDPAHQAQRPLLLDLDASTHLMVLGAARSGRTTVLRALAGAVAATPPDDVHLYALDGGGGLAGLAALPQTGAVVGLDQAERVDRLLQHLVRETDRRRALLAAAGLGGLAEQRATASPGGRLPHLLLLLDRWEAFTAAFGDLDAGRLVDLVHQLLREGPSVGLHVVLTADRSGLVGRVASLVPDRLVLRMADPTDLAVAGVPPRAVPSVLPPGRGWSTTPVPLTVQVALLDPDPGGPAQVAALAALAARVPEAARPPHPVGVLPTRVALRALPVGDVPRRVVLGVGGDALHPVALDVPPALLVAGPPGSGRSTALAVLAAGLAGPGRPPLVALAPRTSPLRALPGCLVDPDPTELAERLGDGPSVLLVDDAELVLDGPLGPLLERLVRTARDRDAVVVAAGTTAALLTGYRGAVVELRRARSGLLLRPETPGDGDLLGLRLSRLVTGQAPPGRGLLVHGGEVVPLQVACPSAPPGPHLR